MRFWQHGCLLMLVCGFAPLAAKDASQEEPPSSETSDPANDDTLDSPEVPVKVLLPLDSIVERKPAGTQLVLKYESLADSARGYFTFYLAQGHLIVEHRHDNFMGFETANTENDKLDPVPFGVSFIINGQYGIVPEAIVGKERTIFRIGNMPTIGLSIGAMPKRVLFEKTGGYLTDSTPIPPQVGENIMIASPFNDEVETYQVESRGRPGLNGTEIFKLRDPEGAKYVLKVFSDAAVATKSFNTAWQDHTARLGGSRVKNELISTGVNFILQKPVNPGCQGLF